MMSRISDFILERISSFFISWHFFVKVDNKEIFSVLKLCNPEDPLVIAVEHLALKFISFTRQIIWLGYLSKVSWICVFLISFSDVFKVSTIFLFSP